MEAIREYILRITVAALICGIATKLINKGTVGGVIKLMAGIFLALSVISPLLKVRIDDLSDYTLDIQLSADQIAAEGEKNASDAMADIISQRVAAYILDKAESLGVTLSVVVTVSADDYPVPDSVTLEGSVSPYAKTILSEYITQNLGISTEDQIWIS